MTEYIDRDKTIAEIDDCFPANPTSEFSKGVAVGLAMAKVAVNHTPTADVRPVVLGEWVKYAPHNSDMMTCSECEKYWILDGDQYDYHYCPNCGARMEES